LKHREDDEHPIDEEELVDSEDSEVVLPRLEPLKVNYLAAVLSIN